MDIISGTTKKEPMTTTLNANEEEYLKLVEKTQWEELEEEELIRYMQLKKKLRIKYCKTCKGEGYFSFPSMMGPGYYDEGACKACEGTGSKGQSAELHQELIKLY